MKTPVASVLLATLLLPLGAATSLANEEGEHPPLGILPTVDLYTGTCYIPRNEIPVEDESPQLFETTVVTDCKPTLETTARDSDSYRAYSRATRQRPNAAGAGPNGIVFDSNDYDPPTPCAVILPGGEHAFSFDWSTAINARPGPATRYNITCYID